MHVAVRLIETARNPDQLQNDLSFIRAYDALPIAREHMVDLANEKAYAAILAEQYAPSWPSPEGFLTMPRNSLGACLQ